MKKIERTILPSIHPTNPNSDNVLNYQIIKLSNYQIPYFEVIYT